MFQQLQFYQIGAMDYQEVVPGAPVTRFLNLYLCLSFQFYFWYETRHIEVCNSSSKFFTFLQVSL